MSPYPPRPSEFGSRQRTRSRRGRASRWYRTPPLPAMGWVREFDISSTHHPPRDAPTGHGRGVIALTEGAAWVTNAWTRTLSRVDLATLKVTAVLDLSKAPIAIAADAGGAWVLCRNGWLWRVWLDEPRLEGVARVGRRARSISADDRAVWTLRDGGALTQVEPTSGEIVLEVSVGRGARRVLSGPDAVWVLTRRGRCLEQIDPQTGRTRTKTRLPAQGMGPVLSNGTVWVAYGHRDRHRRRKGAGGIAAIEADTGALDKPFRLPGRPRAIAASGDAIWIACARPGKSHDATIQRFDPASRRLRAAVGSTRWPVDWLAVSERSVLATMNVAGTNHGGGDGAIFLDFGGGGGGDGGGGGAGGG